MRKSESEEDIKITQRSIRFPVLTEFRKYAFTSDSSSSMCVQEVLAQFVLQPTIIMGQDFSDIQYVSESFAISI